MYVMKSTFKDFSLFSVSVRNSPTDKIFETQK